MSKTAAKWSKYNSSSPKATVYYKPNTAWANAYVHYDDDVNEPFYNTVKMQVHNASNPLIFKAEVYVGAMVSFSDGSDFDTSAKKDQGSVFNDISEPVYVAKDRSWTTLDNAMTNDIYPYDLPVKETNFNDNDVQPTDGKLVGFDAYYYDYLSDYERITNWRENLNDENFTTEYRMQFSSLNNEIIALANQNSNKNWRYPLLFGDDYNASFFIDKQYNNLTARTNAITKDKFRAVNNSGFLGSDTAPAQNDDVYRKRSIMGLVQDSLKSGDLYATSGTNALKLPYFDHDWLMQDGPIANKEVLYVLDDANLGQNGIWGNFWKENVTATTDIHPIQMSQNSVTIGGKAGILYAFILDPDAYDSAQITTKTRNDGGVIKGDYSADKICFEYKYTLSNFNQIATTNGQHQYVTDSSKSFRYPEPRLRSQSKDHQL